MALITRVSRLLRADLHAVLDRMEEPEVLLRQAVREMEDELARERQAAKLMRHEHARLVARESELERTVAEIDEQLDVCFASAKDDLARTLVRRKLETQQLSRLASSRRETLGETLAALDARLTENEAQLEGMRQKVELLSEDEDHGSAERTGPAPDVAVRDEDVEVALLREKHRRQPS
jgi:phage shock protein A